MPKTQNIERVILSPAKQETFKEQILLVLDDYSNTKDPLRFKHDMAKRIMENLRAVAKLKTVA